MPGTLDALFLYVFAAILITLDPPAASVLAPFLVRIIEISSVIITLLTDGFSRVVDTLSSQ